MENEKFPMTALREIRILQLLNHENVINLVEYNRERGSIFLVFDFCEHDLAGLLCCEEVRFSLQEIKSIMQQLFNALFFIHGVRILNRDMKSSNILITRSGVLKLGDFGLARAMSKGQVQRYTNRVITLWYRPPELFLGERNYATPIDMWGAGCIMCEMWTRRPIMQGDSEQKQISLISNLCGSITPEVWPGVESLELYCKLQLPSDQKRRIRERLRHYVRDMHAIDLIDKLLVLDPKKRLDSDGALNHDFFWEDPMPSQSDLAHTLSKVRRSMFVMHTSTARPGGGAGVPGAGGGAVAGNTNHFHDRVF
ncbi:Cyclin-dependent kinase 9 [Geodia barretti]|uniref:Cyclin-dependent kinase 9 n=1 Tax=Geodia barretti TaxID=519541 RepID=A0AA35WL89_GEOBA|nr:Cyclin-dependent kinase 9 [Geodia barretti]